MDFNVGEKNQNKHSKFDTKFVIPHPVEMTWSVQKTPIARDGHGAVRFGNSMYIFGGNSEIGPLNDLWKFDFTKKIWICLKDTPCSGRYSFSMHLWQEKFIVLFGGCSAVTSPSNSKGSNSMTVLKDLLLYDISENKWRILPEGGLWPDARYYYFTSTLNSNRKHYHLIKAKL